MKPSTICLRAAELMSTGRERSYVHAIEKVAAYKDYPFEVGAIIHTMKDMFDFLGVGIAFDSALGWTVDEATLGLLLAAEHFKDYEL